MVFKLAISLFLSWNKEHIRNHNNNKVGDIEVKDEHKGNKETAQITVIIISWWKKFYSTFLSR